MKKYKSAAKFKPKSSPRMLADEPISRVSRELRVSACAVNRWCHGI